MLSIPSSDVRIGDLVRLIGDAVESHPEEANRYLRVTHVAHSATEHPGYDDAAGGGPLIDMETADTKDALGYSLYDWEFEIVSRI